MASCSSCGICDGRKYTRLICPIHTTLGYVLSYYGAGVPSYNRHPATASISALRSTRRQPAAIFDEMHLSIEGHSTAPSNPGAISNALKRDVPEMRAVMTAKRADVFSVVGRSNGGHRFRVPSTRASSRIRRTRALSERSRAIKAHESNRPSQLAVVQS